MYKLSQEFERLDLPKKEAVTCSDNYGVSWVNYGVSWVNSVGKYRTLHGQGKPETFPCNQIYVWSARVSLDGNTYSFEYSRVISCIEDGYVLENL